MYVPFFSEPSKDRLRRLYRRKGGGGGGKGGGGGAKGGSAGGGSSGGGRSSPINSGGSSRPATAYGPGGGRATTIPGGQFFAGRTSGGGTRSQVFGTSQYGSGYPGITGRGVAGRGFPFAFWPLAWGGVIGAGTGAYLHTSEYGRPNNSSRPGGAQVAAAFTSSSNTSTFRLLADNTTVTELIQDIRSNCSSSLAGNSSTSSSAYQDSLTALPQPEQAVQYYRASSVALTLDGYNNSAVFSSDDNTPNTPLPSNVDMTLLNCLNDTIGAAVPLTGGSSSVHSVSTLQRLGISVLLLWFLFA